MVLGGSPILLQNRLLQCSIFMLQITSNYHLLHSKKKNHCGLSVAVFKLQWVAWHCIVFVVQIICCHFFSLRVMRFSMYLMLMYFFSSTGIIKRCQILGLEINVSLIQNTSWYKDDKNVDCPEMIFKISSFVTISETHIHFSCFLFLNLKESARICLMAWKRPMENK